MMRTARWTFAAIAGAVLFGASGSEALAAGGYGAVAGQQSGGGSGSALPFTGMDLLAYGAIAIAIVTAGLVLRAISTRRSHK
jgi:hypothetical protein